MKKAGIYIRVSTREQAQEGYSIQAQKESLISYCKAKNWSIKDIYIDGGYTGSNLERPAIQKLLKDLENIDIVLVYKLDRLSRSQKDTLFLIEEKFIPSEVDFVSLQETLDTSSPFGKAMIGILSVFAQLERETIKERSYIGRKERAKEGYWKGGGNLPTGYDYNPDLNTLVINEYEAMQVRMVYDMYLKGYGTNKIALIMRDKGYTDKYGKWGDRDNKVKRILQNNTYIGKIEFNGEVYEGQHEPIIDEDTFNRVQVLFKKNSEKFTINNSKNLLTGFIYCGSCDARYFAFTQYYKYKGVAHRNKKYGCYSRRKVKQYMIKDPNCTNRHMDREELESYVVNYLENYNFDEEMIRSEIGEKEKINTSAIENEIKSIDKKINKLMDLYASDNMPVNVLSDKIDDLYKEKKSLEDSLMELEVEEDVFDFKYIKEILSNFSLIWENSTHEERRTILSELIDKIIIYDNYIDIKTVWDS